MDVCWPGISGLNTCGVNLPHWSLFAQAPPGSSETRPAAALQLQSFGGAGDDETQAMSVQGLARHQDHIRLGFDSRGQVGKAQVIAPAVNLVRQHRTADTCQVDADLVRSPRLGVDPAKAVAAEAFDRLVVAGRFLAVVFVLGDHHLDAVVRMAADACFDVVTVTVEHAGGDGQILLEDLAVLELQGEILVDQLVLGHEDDAARVAVKAMHDARPVFTAQCAERTEVEGEGVGQCPVPVPPGRMNDHVGGLVDDREVLVLVERIERNVLGAAAR